MAKKTKKKPQKTHSAAQKKTPLEKEAQRLFNHAQQRNQKFKRSNPLCFDSLDFDDVRTKRRMMAAVRYTDKVLELANGICSDIPDVFYVDDEWINLNSENIFGYDFHNEFSHLDTAAALWMLDRISDQRIMEQAKQLIPEDSYDAVLPEIYDLTYSPDLLRGVVSLIQKRNSDCTGIKPRVLRPLPDNVKDEVWRHRLLVRFYEDDYIAANKQHQEVNSRNRFEKFLALIDEEAVKTAVAHFEEKMWEWMTRFFRWRNTCAVKEGEFDKKYNALVERMEQGREQYLSEESRTKELLLESAQKGKLPDLPGFSFSEMSRSMSLSTIPSTPNERLIRYMEKEKAVWESYIEEIKGLQGYIANISEHCNEYPLMSYVDVMEEVGVDAADAFCRFKIDDPFEICFAALYLLDSGSELPWLYFPALAVTKIAANMLPWHEFPFEDEKDVFWHWKDRKTGKILQEKEHRQLLLDNLPKRYKIQKLENWYQMNYADRYSEKKVSLAQVAYRLTGCVMPRNLSKYDVAVEELERYGVTGKKRQVPMLHCLNLLGNARHQEQIENQSLELDNAEDTSAMETESIDELKAKLQAQKKEIERLKRAAYEAERQTDTWKRKAQEQEAAQKSETQELYDLRELVFNQQEGTFEDELTENEKDSIRFPYQTERRIVVFGGHDTWSKAIRPMLPDVRFVNRGSRPNADMIRGADVVWIQANALAHKDFYAIINEVRKYHVPLRYFTYASAERCARQIVAHEQEHK